jgi:hypothetical protein
VSKRIVSWDEYCEMTEEEQSLVTVVTFTGLTECATLEERPAAPDEGYTRGGAGGKEQ